jgi:glycolate oxidase FAD binding subunit
VGVTAAPPSLEIDGLVPRATVAARSEEEVAAAIRAANADGSAVVLWGGGTRIGIGGPLERYDVALDLRGLAGIVAYEPADMTATVSAGTTLAELAAALAAHGQWWPVEVAHPERATVGGTIASAVAGASRLRYLHPRDWVVGSRAVLGDGTVTRAGGRVVKNATGFDLPRMYAGSFGTLCALTELSLKLIPLPERTLTLRADLPDLSFSYARVRELLRSRLPLDAVAVVAGEAASLGSATWTSAFVRLASTPAAVDRLRGAVERVLGAMEEVESTVWQRLADLPADAPMTVRATWPAGEPLEVYSANAVWYPGIEIFYTLDEREPDDIRELRQGAEERGGAAVIEKAPVELKRALGTWGTPRSPVDIGRRLRAAFDPRSVLAPGRMP